MADVFYFNSTHESASDLARHRSTLKRRADARRKIKGRFMDVNMYTQRACVARYDEPVFCPSDASNLLLPGSLTTATPSTNFELYDDCNEALDDDDEGGGVQLPPANDDAIMADEDDLHDSLQTIQTAYDYSAFSDDTTPQMYFHSGPSHNLSIRGPSIPRPVHPRPETRDLWEEEDGRRLRLALEGNGPDEEPRFAFPALALHSSNQTPRGLASRSESRQSRAQSQASNTASALPSRRASTHGALDQQQAQTDGWFGSNFDTWPAPLGQLNMEANFDEDALAIDDPRRDYDFADFMDNWRLRSIKDRRLPPFELGPQTSIRLGRPTRPVSRHDIASSVDMQGIRWEVIGPFRGSAIKARSILHPSPASVTTETRHAKRSRQHGKHYQFRSFNPAHKAKVSHYQLRNVLGATSRNEVFYAIGSQVMRTSLACPDVQQTVMDLSRPQSSNVGFRVTCLSAPPRQSLHNQEVLVVGGFFGEYAVCNIDSADGAVSEGFVTHAYNGLVTHIHTYGNRRSGMPQAAFCSNDRMVRLMDVPSLRFTNEFAYEHAINCASTSPDRRLRVLVGDSQETLITNAETGHTLVTLREQGDHGFACDWSQDGVHVATAAQDGVVLIWDARNWSKPYKSWGSSTSCARSVQWTDNGALVVAENDDIVRVYDGAQGQHYQEVNFFGSIAGVALVDGGEELIVANADKTVGGLLLFERSAQGFGEWSTRGRQVDEEMSWSSVREVEATSSLVADIVV